MQDEDTEDDLVEAPKLTQTVRFRVADPDAPDGARRRTRFLRLEAELYRKLQVAATSATGTRPK